MAAYQVMKESEQDESDEYMGYERFHEKLKDLMDKAMQREYLPLIHTLIFMESIKESDS